MSTHPFDDFSAARRELLRLVGAGAVASTLTSVASAQAVGDDKPVVRPPASAELGFWVLPGSSDYQRFSSAWTSGFRVDNASSAELSALQPILPSALAPVRSSLANYQVRVLGIDGLGELEVAIIERITALEKEELTTLLWNHNRFQTSPSIRMQVELSAAQPLTLQSHYYYGRSAVRTRRFSLPAAPGIYFYSPSEDNVDWSRFALITQNKHGPGAYRLVDARTGLTPNLRYLMMTVGAA
jgi:hypothetical protein